MPINTKGFTEITPRMGQTGISSLSHENSHKDLCHIICTMFTSQGIQKSIRNYQVISLEMWLVTWIWNCSLYINYTCQYRCLNLALTPPLQHYHVIKSFCNPSRMRVWVSSRPNLNCQMILIVMSWERGSLMIADHVETSALLSF